jgi:hypothetical protein
MTPAKQPRISFAALPIGTSFTIGLPFLVIATDSRVALTSPRILRQFLRNSRAVIVFKYISSPYGHVNHYFGRATSTGRFDKAGFMRRIT